jgi:hypothetical protein
MMLHGDVSQSESVRQNQQYWPNVQHVTLADNSSMHAMKRVGVGWMQLWLQLFFHGFECSARRDIAVSISSRLLLLALRQKQIRLIVLV